MKFDKRSAGVVLAALSALLAFGASRAAADDEPSAAALAPADTQLFIQINDAAQLRASLEADPLVDLIRPRLRLIRNEAAWTQVQQMMGMSGQQLLDRYFGRTIAVLSAGADPGLPGLILTRINPDDAALAIERLKLRSLGQAGRFSVYATSDDHGRIAFSDQWMALGDTRQRKYIERVLGGVDEADSLAEDQAFEEWTARLPAKYAAMAYATRDQGDEVHAAALVRRPDGLSVHYAGRHPDVQRELLRVGRPGPQDFGPIPANALAAFTLNLYDPRPAPPAARLIDRILAPTSFKSDVLPLLSEPVVAFVAEVPVDDQASQSQRIPAVGVAIRLRDPKIAVELDRLFDGLVLLANFATIEWGTDPIALSVHQHGRATYRVAGAGAVLAQRADASHLEQLVRPTYGRIDRWYVLCSHEQLFRQCVEADPAAGRPMFEGPSNATLAAAFLQSQALADALDRWIGQMRRIAEAGGAERPWREVSRGLSNLAAASRILNRYKSVQINIFEQDEEAVGLEVRITRPADVNTRTSGN